MGTPRGVRSERVQNRYIFIVWAIPQSYGFFHSRPSAVIWIMSLLDPINKIILWFSRRQRHQPSRIRTSTISGFVFNLSNGVMRRRLLWAFVFSTYGKIKLDLFSFSCGVCLSPYNITSETFSCIAYLPKTFAYEYRFSKSRCITVTKLYSHILIFV